MNTWQRLLREHDPAAAEARLAAPDVDAIRRAAVAAAAREPQRPPVRWRQPLAMAAIVVLMIGAGAVAGRRVNEQEQRNSPAAVVPVESPSEPRQLQFATPGGTRIIWVFNPEFELKETIP